MTDQQPAAADPAAGAPGGEDDAWLRRLLVDQPAEAVPDAVAASVMAALARAQREREAGEGFLADEDASEVLDDVGRATPVDDGALVDDLLDATLPADLQLDEVDLDIDGAPPAVGRGTFGANAPRSTNARDIGITGLT